MNFISEMRYILDHWQTIMDFLYENTWENQFTLTIYVLIGALVAFRLIYELYKAEYKKTAILCLLFMAALWGVWPIIVLIRYIHKKRIQSPDLWDDLQ